VGSGHQIDPTVLPYLSPPTPMSSAPCPGELITAQSIEGDVARRKQILWQIERKLAEDDARPIIFYADRGTCTRPNVKGAIVNTNSIFNAARREEDVWLDK
jgi:peptide/nickel transport system substrate-binding protein